MSAGKIAKPLFLLVDHSALAGVTSVKSILASLQILMLMSQDELATL
jgi:hypothetical protein